MHPDQKKRIIKRYLEQISEDDTVIADEEIENVPFYDELGHALDVLEQRHDPFFDFANVELDLAKWQQLSEVFQSGLTITVGSPSVMTAINLKNMIDQARDLEDRAVIGGLPQSDFYNRVTSNDAVTQTGIIDPLIVTGRAKLAGLLRDFTDGTDFDATNNDHVESLIKQLTDEKKQAIKDNNPDQEALLKKYLAIAKDLHKVNNLTSIKIPNESGGEDIYCSLAEAAGGVTEKVSLVSLATVQTQLGHLRDTDVGSVDDYMNHHDEFKLGMEGILKLPKHGDIKEVQREAMALNVSRMLGLDTTRSTFMTHEGKPVLFVPFDNIKLMSEYASGKTFKAFDPFKKETKTYEHYSTINPVGEGLQGNQFTDDFGNSLGLFYLCSDTDGMGGYNQNKALRNDRSLYIFDQVIMSKDKMKLDSRLSLQPDELVKKHTRHGQGRNRTIIEDSSLDTKFGSLMNLLVRSERIYKYATAVADTHQREIQKQEGLLNNPDLGVDDKRALQQQHKQVKELKKDAIEIRDAMKKRMDKIYGVLPKVKSTQLDRFNPTHARQALVLEKLLHNPTLFTESGRPYRNPWTYRQSNSVKSLEFLNNGNVLLKFGSNVSKDMVAFIKRRGGGDSLIRRSSKEIEISEQDLLALRETMLCPTSQARLQHGVNYLDPNDLKQISKAYGEGHRGRILKLVNEYNSIMAKPTTTQDQKLIATRNVAIFLKRYIDTAKDKGFGKHVLKKMQFDIQQRLQAMIPHDQIPGNLDQAFAAALKLDQVDVFNKVVAEAIKSNRLDSIDFQNYLQNCIDQEAQATNHAQASVASQLISDRGNELIEVFRIPVEVLEDIEDIELDEIDPVHIREEELHEERVVINEVNIVPHSSPQTTIRRTEDDKDIPPTIEVKM